MRWARDQSEVRAARRLRHHVFVDELGARLEVPRGTPPGHDADLFDDFCEHLLVGAVDNDGEPQVLATCRILVPSAARRAGALHSDAEFDLVRLRPLQDRMIEVSRS